jgi:hypothetical protein
MSPTVRYARLKTAEYEKLAAAASDPEVRRYYIQLASDCGRWHGSTNGWRASEIWRGRKISRLDSFNWVPIKSAWFCCVSVPVRVWG